VEEPAVVVAYGVRANGRRQARRLGATTGEHAVIRRASSIA
jgi:hypothetical protein